MSILWCKLIDIDGKELGLIEDFSELQVELPWLDSATGSVKISMDDKNAKKIRPMDRLIKVYYGDYFHPVFIGHIGQPDFDYAQRTITCPLHDPTIKLKLHNVRYGDRVVDVGYPVDGRGARRIVECSIPWDNQLARGVKPNGILWGQNLTVSQASIAAGGIWGKCIRGENVWDALQKLAQKDIGPDFRFEFLDGLDPGYFCRMHVGAKYDDAEGGAPLSADRTGPDGDVKFIYGVNADQFNVQPDGFAIRNYWVAVNPGGERNRADAAENRGLYHSESSWEQYGIMEGWESVGEKVALELLQLEAKQWVKNYAQPPTFFTVAPRQDAANVPKLMWDFLVGDFITASGKYRNKWGDVFEETIDGRVMKATIQQAVDGSKQSRLVLECAPLTDGGAAIGDDA
jgi:hypothetical protein